MVFETHVVDCCSRLLSLFELDSGTTTVKRPSPPPSSASPQISPNSAHDNASKKRSPPSVTTGKRVSPRESPSKSQPHSPGSNVTEFNMKPAVEPLEIRIESNSNKKNSPSPTKRVSNNGLLTSETDNRRSSTGVSKLIHTFQSNVSNDLDQTVLVPRLRSPGQGMNTTEAVSNYALDSNYK